MNTTWTALRAGLVRGRIELRHTFTNAQDLWTYLFPSAIFLIVMLFMKGSTVAGTNFSLGSLTLPSVLGVGIGFSGLIGMAQLLTVEREDGTLLRAKAIPNGMAGYLVGKVVLVSGMTLVGFLIQLVAGVFLFDGLVLDSVGGWLILGMIMLPIMALVGISGMFYPITHFPQWLQGIAQVFPLYWLGLGMRSALLSDSLAAVEISGSWRHLETVGVLGTWAVAGLIVAPIVLRRMARRESGSSVAARREKAMQRVT